MNKTVKYALIFSALVALLSPLVIITPCYFYEEYYEELQVQMRPFDTQIKQKDYAIFIDYTKPVFKKRLWVIDLKTKNVVLNCHVAHAYKSGKIWPTKFSNVISSNISSKGSFITGFDYEGNYGHAMKIHGLEKENNNVFDRTIVFHPAARYLYGIALPIWTNGCFATSRLNMDKIIKFTQNGSFIYVSV
jgi:hypothetical protein